MLELRLSTCTFKINALYSELKRVVSYFMEPGIIHGDPATLLFVVTGGIVMHFIFMSTRICFVTLPGMGGIMVYGGIAPNLSQVPVHMKATFDCSLINTMGTWKIRSDEHVCAHEHANMAD